MDATLVVISTVSMSGFGPVTTMLAGDGRGIGPLSIEFMETHEIRISDLVARQFEKELIASGIPLRVDAQSKNILRITLNIVVIGMKHGFSRDLNCRFNITGELLDPSGKILWAYNAIPLSPTAPGYSLTPEEMFASKEAFVAFLEAGSLPSVKKLFRNFERAY